MKKQAAYDPQTDTTVTVYILDRWTGKGLTHGDFRRAMIYIPDGTPRGEIARRLWDELRPAVRGLKPFDPRKLFPVSFKRPA